MKNSQRVTKKLKKKEIAFNIKDYSILYTNNIKMDNCFIAILEEDNYKFIYGDKFIRHCYKGNVYMSTNVITSIQGLNNRKALIDFANYFKTINSSDEYYHISKEGILFITLDFIGVFLGNVKKQLFTQDGLIELIYNPIIKKCSQFYSEREMSNFEYRLKLVS